MNRIYLDYAATTPLDPEVVAAMTPYWGERFGNPASMHWHGREAKAALDSGRDAVAAAIGAQSAEIIFTSGGTEADNLAILGVAAALQERGRHMVTTAVEHHAAMESCHLLEHQGWKITYLPVDHHGHVSPAQVSDAITDQTVLVSVMLANNEIGTIEPIAEITRVTRARGVYLHTDAVQALPWLPAKVDELGVDLMSMSAHKLYGPKGTGALYVRQGTRLAPISHGGAQEQGRRSGTEDVAGIVGFAKALELATARRSQDGQRLRALRDRFVAGAMERIEQVWLNGHPTSRLPNNAHLSFADAESEPLLLNLDLEGISVSAGAACASGGTEPSHVLKAIGLKTDLANSSLRFSLGRPTTEAEMDRVLEVLPGIVGRLREIRRSGTA